MIGEALRNLGVWAVHVAVMLIIMFVVFTVMALIGAYVIEPISRRTPKPIRRICNWFCYGYAALFILFVFYQIGKG